MSKHEHNLNENYQFYIKNKDLAIKTLSKAVSISQMIRLTGDTKIIELLRAELDSNDLVLLIIWGIC